MEVEGPWDGNQMPDVSDLHEPLLPLWISARRGVLDYGVMPFPGLIPPTEPLDPQVEHLVTDFLRLVDHTAVELQLAKNTLDLVDEELLSEPAGQMYAFIYVLEASGHFESAINSLYRAAAKSGNHLRQRESVPAFPRHTDVFREPSLDILRELRHGMEHMDERILAGDVGAEDHPANLLPMRSMLKGPNAELSYSRLIGWVGELVDVGRILLRGPYGTSSEREKE